MGTFLFNDIIFGPVDSRRLGVSLGINLLPVNVKVCSFNCIYCECGFTPAKYRGKVVMPTRDEVRLRLKKKLREMVLENHLPDVITFAGNGEPTLHPAFPEIINDTLELRNEFAPAARIAVLSNATMLHKPRVVEALLRVNDNIQKLDSALSETIKRIDCPHEHFDLEKVITQLIQFHGKVIIQTLFLKGSYNSKEIDNTTDNEVEAWLGLLLKINPEMVMIYTIARDTPVDTLEKVSPPELDAIAGKVKQLGFKVQVSY